MNTLTKTVAVVGGGMAGASAALDLADAGIQVELIEKSPFIGGHAANIACKALDSCQHCNGCLVDPTFEAVLGHARINIRRRTKVMSAKPTKPGYTLKLHTNPAYLDSTECSSCGLCLEQCPEPGAIISAPYAADAVKLAIDPQKCLYFKDQKSTICRDIRPVEAISFAREPEEKQLTADALIIATGFLPYDPSVKLRLGYGRIPDVITAMELEKLLRKEGLARRPSDGEPARKVAFIQCVGSREREGHNYCSRICCTYALRLGRALHKNQDAQVSIFHMDLQSFGEDFDAYLADAHKELNLLRAMPYDIMPGMDGGAKVVYQPASGQKTLAEPFDLVVLSQAITPHTGQTELWNSLGISRNEHGFLIEGKGVFVAGTAAAPMDLKEVQASAGRASQSVLMYLEAQ